MMAAGVFACGKPRRGLFRGQRGVTLIELAVTLAIISTVAVAGITSYKFYMEQSKANGAQWLVYNLLVRTRSEALSQGRAVNTTQLLLNPESGGVEASSLSGWLASMLELDPAEVTVVPESVAFDGRGRSLAASDPLSLVISLDAGSRTVYVARSGMVSKE